MLHSEPLAYLQLPELRFQGHNGLLCPHVPTPPPKSQLHSWCFAIVVGAAWGWCRRGWALGTETGADRPWSAVSMQVTFAGTATRPASLAQNGNVPGPLGPFAESPPGHTRPASSPARPLGACRWGGFSPAFSASCYFGATLGHRPSPRCRKGLSAAAQLALEEGSGGKRLGGENG